MRRLLILFAIISCGPPPPRTGAQPAPCDGTEFLVVSNNGTQEANIVVGGTTVGIVGPGRHEFRLLPPNGRRMVNATPATDPNKRQGGLIFNVSHVVECRHGVE